MHKQLVQQDALKHHITTLENKLKIAMDYINQLINPQINLRLLNVPEYLEGKVGMTTFLIKLLETERKVTLT